MDQKEKRKIDKIELSKRIRVVQDWMLQDHTTADIISQIKIQWGPISDRQAYRYIWAAKKFFEEKDEMSLQRKKAFYIQRKRKLLRDMNPEEKKTAAGALAVSKILDSMAKLEGVTTDTLKLIGDPDKPIKTETVVKSDGVDYRSMPTELLEHIVSQRKNQ